MSAIKELAGTPQTLEASGGSISNTAAGQANDAVLDNTTELAFWYDFRLVAGFGSSVAAGTAIYLYLLAELDGSNPQTADTTTPLMPPDAFSGIFNVVTTGTGTRPLDIKGVPVGPYKYQAWLVNATGQTLSSWTLTAYPVKAQN